MMTVKDTRNLSKIKKKLINEYKNKSIYFFIPILGLYIQRTCYISTAVNICLLQQTFVNFKSSNTCPSAVLSCEFIRSFVK